MQNQTAKPAASHLIDFDMWLACHTQEEIADAVGLTHQGVAKVSDDFANSVLQNQSCKPAASHLTDFDMWLACHTQEEIAEASDCPLGTVKGLLAGDNSLVGMVLKNQTNQPAASHLIDFDMWLACHTQEEIAEAVDEPVGTIGRLVSADDFLHSVLENQTKKPAASHLIDFDPPIYNVWKQARTPGSSHFGNSESRWVVPPVPLSPGACLLWSCPIMRRHGVAGWGMICGMVGGLFGNTLLSLHKSACLADTPSATSVPEWALNLRHFFRSAPVAAGTSIP